MSMGSIASRALGDGRPADVAHLKRVFHWLQTAALALGVLAAVAGAFSRGGTGLRASTLILPIAIVLLLFWQIGVRALETLSEAVAEQERLRDALAAMRAQEEHFRELAYQDDLTGLPNQRLFHDRLAVAIRHCSRERNRLAVLYLDLDGFKSVNDSLGHGLGDRLLVELAGRIRASVRDADTVARLGGDEFAVLLPQVTGAEDAGRVATKVLDALSAPFRLGGAEVSISSSVGVSVFPGGGRSAEDLVRNADAAMYRAKRNGRHVMLHDAGGSGGDVSID
jgi:diguanylate cyclase (GGDEF)-like protein